MIAETQNMDVHAILLSLGSTTHTVVATECTEIWLDKETRGVFYRLDPDKHPLPIEGTLLYAPPYHIINIMFKPRKNGNS